MSSLTLLSDTMWLCKECVSQSLSCCVRSESFKCSECTAHTFWKCDLVISKTEWAKIQCERTHLCTELCEAIAHVSQLQQQSDLMKSHWDEIVQHEFQNIKELKADEACKASEAAVMLSLNEFLLNVSSDQIKVPVDFDLWSWPENVPSEDTSQ